MKSKPQIFLSYVEEDQEKAENLYQRLLDEGFKPWMDKKDLLPGDTWESRIPQTIRHSDFFLPCLSTRSTQKRGFFQKEIVIALDVHKERLESDRYLIPVRLENCEMPERLRAFQWANLFEADGWEKLKKAIRADIERQAIVDEQPEADSIEWHKSGNLFWASHDLMLTIDRLLRDAPKEAIFYALQQSLHHVRELGFDYDHHVESKLNELLARANRTPPEGWTKELRESYVSELDPLKGALGDLASASQERRYGVYNRGPKSSELGIPLHE